MTAAKLLAESALAQGKYFQAFPEYGAERMGAPIQAFTRISGEKISRRCSVTEPDIVVVLDDTLLGIVNVAQGLPAAGVLLVNTDRSPADVRSSLSLDGQRVFTLDATKIALETIGKPIPNTPMLGALIKATDIMSLDKMLEHLEKSFGKKFAPEIIEGNVAAVRRAYEEVKSE